MDENDETMGPALQDGPAHLRNAAELSRSAREILQSPEFEHDTPEEIAANAASAQALAQIAQAEAGIATALVFGALAAGEGEEFGTEWAELIDPDGTKRAAAKRQAKKRARKARRAEKQRQAEFDRKSKEYADAYNQPIDYTLNTSYNPGPLVPAAYGEPGHEDGDRFGVPVERDPGLTDEQVRHAGNGLAAALLADDFDDKDGA